MLPQAVTSCGAFSGRRAGKGLAACGAKVAPLGRDALQHRRFARARGSAHHTPFGKMGAGLRGLDRLTTPTTNAPPPESTRIAYEPKRLDCMSRLRRTVAKTEPVREG